MTEQSMHLEAHAPIGMIVVLRRGMTMRADMGRILVGICVMWGVGLVSACGQGDEPEQMTSPEIIIEEEPEDEPDRGVADMSPEMSVAEDMSEIIIIFDDMSDEPDMSDMPEDLGPPDMPSIDILTQLRLVDQITSVSELNRLNGQRVFAIDIEQALDHFEEGSPTFTQRVYLLYSDRRAPMVMLASGYAVGTPEQYAEFTPGVTQLLGANQLLLGHRFFNGAVPPPELQDWSKLNIKQGAADNHRVVEALKPIFGASWIGTGWSKGGMTALFHERFYPEDLDLVLPMVAPITQGIDDARYEAHLAQIGPTACRDSLEQSIVEVLGRMEELLDYYGVPASDRPQSRQYIKHTFAMFPWAFWQSYGQRACPYIPDGATASMQEITNFYFPSQGGMQPMRPITYEEGRALAYTYQAASQLGTPARVHDGQMQRLEMAGVYSRAEYDQAARTYDTYRHQQSPWGFRPAHDPQPMQDIDSWLRADGEDILAIYGEYDPWTGGIITLDEANDSKVYVAPGTSHGARLQDLESNEYQEVVDRIMEHQPTTVRRGLVREAPSVDREALLELMRQNLL